METIKEVDLSKDDDSKCEIGKVEKVTFKRYENVSLPNKKKLDRRNTPAFHFFDENIKFRNSKTGECGIKTMHENDSSKLGVLNIILY